MSDAAIADLLSRVKILEAHAQVLSEVPGQIGGLVAKVRTIETTVGDPKEGLETKVEGLETAVGDPKEGLAIKVEGLETAVRDPKEGLKTKVEGLETAVGDPKEGLEPKVEGLETAVRDPNEGLKTKVEGLETKMLAKQNGKQVPSQVQDLSTKVSRIEGQISTVMWLGPLVVAVIALLVQYFAPR